jgi:hypothetical protein
MKGPFKFALLLFLLLPIFAAAQTTKKVTTGVAMNKGIIFGNATVSLGNRNAENENQLFVYNVRQKKNEAEIRFDGGYMIQKNLGIGMGILYGNKQEDNVQQASDGTLTANQIANRYYAFRPFVKNFIPLGNNNRFFIVVPTELQIGFGNQVKESTTNSILTRTYTQSQFYGLAMRPGLLAFIHKNFGFEVNVGAFGLSTSVDKISTTNQPDGRVVKNDLDLKINILNLSLGFAAYF